VTTSEARAPKGINYRMHPANVGCLTAARIDCCVLANNHVLDWGSAGLEETLARCTRRHPHRGRGRNAAEAAAPAMLALSAAAAGCWCSPTAWKARRAGGLGGRRT
jgi:poly-gamma-glutamate capsule biosynthesis protein CapA/YwtB (metallophosphatase superfamily)